MICRQAVRRALALACFDEILQQFPHDAYALASRAHVLAQNGQRAAALYTLIETCKLNDVDPQAWLADVLARILDHPAKRIAELLPWNWKRQRLQLLAAA